MRMSCCESCTPITEGAVGLCCYLWWKCSIYNTPTPPPLLIESFALLWSMPLWLPVAWDGHRSVMMRWVEVHGGCVWFCSSATTQRFIQSWVRFCVCSCFSCTYMKTCMCSSPLLFRQPHTDLVWGFFLLHHGRLLLLQVILVWTSECNNFTLCLFTLVYRFGKRQVNDSSLAWGPSENRK